VLKPGEIAFEGVNSGGGSGASFRAVEEFGGAHPFVFAETSCGCG